MSSRLARLVRRGIETGQPLPDAYHCLDEWGVKFYRGGVTLVGGVPGSMKTTFLLNLADRLKVPTLYISNDSNEMTVASRLLARRTGIDSKLTRLRALEDPDWAAGVLSDLDWIRWNFSASPSFEDIREEVDAFEELWGEFPHLIIVDVLMKVDFFEGDDRHTDETIVRYLDKLGRDTGSCVVVACHTSENEPGYPCQPMKAFLNKISKLPVMCLTTAHVNGVFYLAPVKNRDGAADASGKTYMTFLIDAATCMLEEM